MANQIFAGVGTTFQVFDSQARTATPDTMEFVLPQGARFLHVVIDVTAATSTPSTVFTVSAVDRLSGKVYTLLASAAIVGTGTTVLRIGPGLTAAANLVASDVVTPVIRFTATHGNANSQTYTVAGAVV